MSYLVLFDEYAINLNLMAGLHEECLADSFGSISEACYVQAGEHDFDKDGIPEIIIAIGNGLSGLHANIFKYYPPEKKKMV